MKFSCVVATDKLTRNGDILTKEALEEMASKMAGTLITLDFKRDFDSIVGKVEKATISESNLEFSGVGLIGELDEKYVPKKRLYCVPQFEIETDDVSEQNGIKIIRHIKRVLSFGLTENPSDEHVTPIERIE